MVLPIADAVSILYNSGKAKKTLDVAARFLDGIKVAAKLREFDETEPSSKCTCKVKVVCNGSSLNGFVEMNPGDSREQVRDAALKKLNCEFFRHGVDSFGHTNLINDQISLSGPASPDEVYQISVSHRSSSSEANYTYFPDDLTEMKNSLAQLEIIAKKQDDLQSKMDLLLSQLAKPKKLKLDISGSLRLFSLLIVVVLSLSFYKFSNKVVSEVVMEKSSD